MPPSKLSMSEHEHLLISTKHKEQLRLMGKVYILFGHKLNYWTNYRFD